MIFLWAALDLRQREEEEGKGSIVSKQPYIQKGIDFTNEWLANRYIYDITPL
jgi:hypothetical protein